MEQRSKESEAVQKGSEANGPDWVGRATQSTPNCGGTPMNKSYSDVEMTPRGQNVTSNCSKFGPSDVILTSLRLSRVHWALRGTSTGS